MKESHEHNVEWKSSYTHINTYISIRIHIYIYKHEYIHVHKI